MTRETVQTPIEAKEYEFVLINGLKEENAKLKQLLNEVVIYGDSYNECVKH